MTILRQSWRGLRARPGLALSGILSIAIGVGAASALLAVLYSVFLRPLPYPEPERLVALWEVSPQPELEGPYSYVSVESFLQLRRESRRLEAVAAFTFEPMVLTGREEALRLSGARATPDLFTEVLRVSATTGRLFAAPEEEEGADAVVVLGHAFWQRTFGGDAGIVGGTIRLDERLRTVVGVLPEDFAFESLEAGSVQRVDVWSPLSPASYREYGPGLRFLQVIGRLAPGVGLEPARAETAALAERLGERLPASHGGWGLRLEPLREQLVGPFRGELHLLGGAALLVLLITSGNLANLLLLRTVQRRKQTAVRAALGASRARRLSELLSESLLLSLLGGLPGGLLAFWIGGVLVAASPVELPRLADLDLLSALFPVTLGCSLLLGLVAALPATAVGLRDFRAEDLKDTERATDGFAGRRLQGALMLTEIALATALLAASGLLARSLWSLDRVELGFRPGGTVAMAIDLPRSRYPSGPRILSFYEELLDRAAALPDVEHVALTRDLPLGGGEMKIPLAAETTTASAAPEDLTAWTRVVSADYFAALGVAVLEGRPFRPRKPDDGVVINRALARRLWPGRSALGRSVRVDWFGQSVGGPVVGVVDDVRHRSTARAAEPAVYLSLLDRPYPAVHLLVRSRREPRGLIRDLRALVASLDRDLPLDRSETLTQILARDLARWRFSTFLVTAFALVALVLSTLGLYGTISYAVQRGARQIAIRMALGARPADELARFLGRASVLVAAGLAIGIVLVLAAGRVLSNLLFEVSPTDPATLLVAVGLLGTVALLAAYLPARRAARLDPLRTLRNE